MSSHRYGVVLTAGFLVISLGLKSVLEPTFIYEYTTKEFADRIPLAFEMSGFVVLDSAQSTAKVGYKSECAIWIGLLRPEGGDEQMFSELYGQDAVISYVYLGGEYDRAPSAHAITNRIINRFSAIFGEAKAPEPIFQMARSNACLPNESTVLARYLSAAGNVQK